MSKKTGISAGIKQHFNDYVSEFVYGGIDGAVTTFAVVAGATGAGYDIRIILVLGFANLIADGFSMGVGSYLSTKSEQEVMVRDGESIKNEPSPIINGASTYAAFIAIGLIPLLAYVYGYIADYSNQDNIFLAACTLTALGFIGIGFLKNKVTKSGAVKSIAETLVLGVIAAVLAYALGDLLEQIIT